VSDVYDEDAIRGCRRLVGNKSCSWNLENDTTHGQTGSTTMQQTAGYARSKLNGEVARHARHPRSILARMSGVSKRMSRGCYEETDSLELKL